MKTNLVRAGRLVALAAIFGLVAQLAIAASLPALAAQSAPATPAIATPATAPSPQLPATVTDAHGKQVTIKDISRIVPLSGDVAEIIWDLGLGSHIVAADVSAVYPPSLQQLPSIGFERQLSAEAIIAAKPTVVIGKEQAGPQPVLDQVSSAGIPVVIVKSPQTIAEPALKIREVAAALGVSAEGEQLATKTQNEIDQATTLAKTATSHPSVMFLYVRSGGVQLIGGKGSVADAMIAAAGGVDAGTAAGINGFQPVTAEAMVAAAPEYIIVPASGVQSIGGIDAILKIPGVAETPAGKAKRILVYDDLELLDLTPRTGQALMALTRAIHPELPSASPVATPAATPAG